MYNLSKVHLSKCTLAIITMALVLLSSESVKAQMGIGTTDPKAKLHVVSSGNTSASTAFRADNSDLDPLFFVRNDGNVGIGTTSPQVLLHVNGAVRVNALAGTGSRYLMADSLGNIIATIVKPGGGDGWSLTGDTGTTFGTNFLGTIDDRPLDIRVFNSSALRIYPTGSSRTPNLVGGHADNNVTDGVLGATIAGGGEASQNGIGENRITDNYGVVGGGTNNQAGNDDDDLGDAHHTTIGGGEGNVALRRWATVAGGIRNSATGSYSFVGGGEKNIASYPYAVVAGGSADSARAGYAAVVGGRRNAALAEYAFIGGGKGNRVLAEYASTLGGKENNIFGDYSTVLGGANNRIRDNKTYSMAFGCGADVNTGCAIVFNHPDIGPNATVFGVRVNNPKHAIHSFTSTTRDEKASIYGNTHSATSKQVMGVWGDASNAHSSNVGTIGVLATGNGNKLYNQTNTALQINDGSLNVGRTTQHPEPGATIAETATGGAAYSAEGPSGVVEIPYMGFSDTSFNKSAAAQWVSRLKINNQYVEENSIILVQVLDHADGTVSQGAFTIDNVPLDFFTSVDGRDDGSFLLTVSFANVDKSNFVYVDGGSTDAEKDRIRVGYLVINPSK